MRTERPRLVNLVVLVVISAAIGLFLRGPAFWLGAVLVCAATAYGAFSLMAELEPRGVPIESLIPPAAAAFATVSVGSVAGPTLLAVPVLAGGAALVTAALVLETRLLGPADPTHPRRQQQLVPLVVLLAFLCFTGVAGAVYGGLEDVALAAPASIAGDEATVLLLVAADALVAFALGYRLAAVQSLSVRQAARAAGTFAVVVAVAAALVRAIALPRPLGPALLAGIFYLWSAYRSASGSERRSTAWWWEYAALAAAALLAVAWNLLLR